MTLRNVRNCTLFALLPWTPSKNHCIYFNVRFVFYFFIFTFSLKVRIFQATFFFLLFFFILSLTALSLYSSWKKSRTFLGGEDGVPKWSCQKARSEWHNPFCICKWNESSLTTLFDFFSGLLFTFLLLFPPSSLAFF